MSLCLLTQPSKSSRTSPRAWQSLLWQARHRPAMAGMQGSSGASGIAGSSQTSVHFCFFARSKVKTLHERIPLAGFSKLPSIPQIAKVTGTGCLLCGHAARGEACTMLGLWGSRSFRFPRLGCLLARLQAGSQHSCGG